MNTVKPQAPVDVDLRGSQAKLGVWSRGRRFPGSALILVLPAAIALLWIAASSGSGQQSSFVPSPSEVWSTAVTLIETGYQGRPLLEHFWASAVKLLYAFVIVATLGFPLGFAMGRNRTAQRLMDPVVEFVRPLPSLAYLSLLILWFGIGLMTQVTLLVVTGFPVAVTAAHAAAAGVSEERLKTARAFGASNAQVFRYVILPSSLPALINGSRIVAGVLFGTVIAAEMVSAREGLGWMIMNASEYLRADVIFVGIFLMAAMGIAMDRFFRILERRFVPWQGKE